MIVVYSRGDLIETAKDKNIRQIELSDIRFSMQPMQLASVVIFLDMEPGLMRIFKWRWKANFDTKGVFSLNEFNDVMNDALSNNNTMGKSLLKPGTDKLRK